MATQAKKKKSKLAWGRIFVCLVAILIVLGGVLAWQMLGGKSSNGGTRDDKAKEAMNQKTEAETNAMKKDNLLKHAEQVAQSYDYDKAIEDIEEAKKLDPKDTTLDTKKAEYETAKSQLVPYSGAVSQVFFHELIVDCKRVFGPKNGNPGGHNSVMTTLKEFNAIIDQMHQKGYILITFNDLYDVKTDVNGKKTFKQKQLLLPKGKKPVIMSQDDVNCYRKTRLAIGGYSSKYVIDDKTGKVKCLYEEEDGTQKVGDYDLLPALETFCEKNPDFSYKGARAYIGLTGFDGALGYRVNHDAEDKSKIEEERKGLTEVANKAKEEGFLFACHSYSHGNQQKESVSFLKEDTKKWLNEIGKYVGKVDHYILPKGNWFINAGWNLQSAETTSRLNVFANAGFDFISGVGCDDYRVGYKKYVFMDRYNFDGFAMHNEKSRLQKFFDVDSVWDSGRPGAKGLN